MKSIVTLAILCALVPASFAQGAPSPAGQSVSDKGEASAEKAVQGRHDKAVARSEARAAKRAAKAASAASK